MTLKDENQVKTVYHCYDCGGIWDINGVDTFTTKDLTKYVCKECRGRCLPEKELGRIRGIKSIRQRFSNRNLFIVLFLAAALIFSIYIYDRRVTIKDYRNYLVETSSLRKIIEPRLETFRTDHKILEKAKTEKLSLGQINDAQYRISSAKKYLYAREFEVDRIKPPETPEVIELYHLETTFWKEPSYSNYINYMGVFNKLKNKYDVDYFEVIKKRVRDTVEKRVKDRLKNSK